MSARRAGRNPQTAELVTRARYDEGVSPQNPANARVNDPTLSKPTADAVCATP